MTDEEKKAEREYQKAYREKNREKVARIKKMWRVRFPEKQAEYDRRSRLRKKGIDPDTWIPPEDRKREYVKRGIDWSDPEQRKAYFRESYRKNIKQRHKTQMSYYWRNREKKQEYNRAKYIDKREEILAQRKSYREKNRELIRIRARGYYKRMRDELGKPYNPKIKDEQIHDSGEGKDMDSPKA